MEIIFMNTKNSKVSEPHRFKLDLTNKLNLKNPKKNMALANLSIYYTIYYTISIKSEYNNNKCKISATTCNDTFDLPNGSYFIADIQDYFELIIKEHKKTLTENPPLQIVNLSLLIPETMKLLGSTKKTLIKIKMEKAYQNYNLLKFILI